MINLIFTYEKTGIEELSNLPRITRLINDGAGNHNPRKSGFRVCTLKYHALVMKRGWDVRMNYFMKEVGGGRPELIDVEASGT